MSDPDIPADEPPSSVLLLAPGFGDGSASACTDLVNAADVPEVLYVSYSGDPTDRLEHLVQHAGTPTASRAVFVGEGAADAEGFDGVETVGAPTDLTGLGIAVTEQLEASEDGVAVCFDSVTSLLQYVDVDTAYEFLHVMVGRLYRHDAVGHLHMDPTAHEEIVVERMTSLVDGRLRLEQDGTVSECRASLRDWC